MLTENASTDTTRSSTHPVIEGPHALHVHNFPEAHFGTVKHRLYQLCLVNLRQGRGCVADAAAHAGAGRRTVGTPVNVKGRELVSIARTSHVVIAQFGQPLPTGWVDVQ
jgi:hypothetical protein